MAKQYISIIRLFEHCSIQYKVDINPVRMKKQLQAEFGFSASGMIEIDGYNYNKNDVFEEIEKTDFIHRLSYHIAVWENKCILAVLEDNAINIPDLKTEIRQFHNDTAFDDFFSPYFAIPFNVISRSYLNEERFEDVGELLLFEDFLQVAEREEAFRPVRFFLDDHISMLKNISEITLKNSLPKLEQWTDPGISIFLNHLPYEFEAVKIDLMVYLVNVTVMIQRSDKKLCKAVSREMVKVLNLPVELSDTIDKNDRIYNRIATADNSSSGGTNYWWVIWVVVILMRILTKC